MYSVFIVDDEPWSIIGLKKLIDWREKGFYIVGEANDGIAAWEKINRLNPNVIFCDIKIPGLNGIELSERIRETKMDTEIVFISGYSEFEYALSGIKLQVFEYLIKPIDSQELRDCLDRVKDKLDRKQDPGSRKNKVEYSSDKVLVDDIIKYIAENYDRKITLNEIAEHFFYSQGYLSELIKKETGQTFTEHLTKYRIKKAEELLRTTNESITKIAEKVGYSDYFYFTKVYKKATGMTPSMYRKQL